MSLYYKDEFVTLYHGDCLEVDEWRNADVLVTDPPYGINMEQRFGSWYGVEKRDRKKSAIKNDKDSFVRDEVLEIWGDKPAIVFGSWRVERPDKTKHRLIWHKAGMSPGPTNAPFMSQDEEIYILGRGFLSTSPPMRSVIRTDENRSIEVSKIGHPTPKPLALMEQLIQRCPVGVIADPFAGSGSTLIAARNQARFAIGVELDEKYCEIIANRLSHGVFDFDF
jgi:site-specific DNA-methyltransferase (adenine-specific)